MQINFNGVMELNKKIKDVVNDLVLSLEGDLPSNSSVYVAITSITKRRTTYRATFKVCTNGQMLVSFCSAPGVVDAVRCARTVILQRLESAKGRMLARRRDKAAADRLVS
jgi:hypothetical protein